MIEGLRVIDLEVHADSRGWFKENWNNKSLPFHPVQQNASMNTEKGTTRGLHAEPWDKIVSVASGRVFGAWCDLRAGSPTYGQTQTHEIGPGTAVFVPRGVANGYQTLAQDTSYIYLVNDHWSPDAQYANVTYRMIDWPLEPVNVSSKDEQHPELSGVEPVMARKILITGANGQLGRALRGIIPEAEFCTRDDFDITNPSDRNWRQYSTIINAAAYNQVDGAETERAQAWAVNAEGPAKLARIAAENDLTLVHVSTDYVYDGESRIYREDDPVAPLSLYGASKAAGDNAVATVVKHYIIRTSWVIGDGRNFVRTMVGLAERGVQPSVVDDQVGRLSFAEDIAGAIKYLLSTNAEYGIYNVTSTGDPVGWDEVAKHTFECIGQSRDDVTSISSDRYFGDKPHAKRPRSSVLDTSKIEDAGFTPGDWRQMLTTYLQQ